MFRSETYKNRRAQLSKDVNEGIILLLGNTESSMNFADNHYHFVQDSSFRYFFGLINPDIAGIIDCDSGEEMLFGDDLTIDQIVWTGFQPTMKELAEQVGIDKTAPFAKLAELVQKALADGRTVHYLPPYRATQRITLSNLTNQAVSKVDEGASVKLIKAIVKQRNIKTTEEIEELEKAVDITAQMHIAAMQHTRPGMKEYEVGAIVQNTAKMHGAELSFPMIITKDGQTLHNHYQGNTLKSGDLLLCDSGAQAASGYCGDMTRTFPVDKKFTSRQAELYQIALDAHEAAIKELAPGKRFKDIHLLAGKTIFEGLKAVGLTKGDTESAVAAGAHTMFMQTGLGHMMGMDVHDMENLGEPYVGYTDELKKSTEFGLKSLRLGKALEAGNVITVEPGIYIIPQLIDLWKSEKKYEEFINYDELEKYKDFGGIRIEEDFVITDEGAKMLGRQVPKTIADVENTRA
jgi:Xaa-Pro aminopeptidase